MRPSSHHCSGSCRELKSIAARDVAIALLAEALSPTHEGCEF